MPRVIVKCRYYTPQNSARDVGGMLRYIGTREGVDRFGIEWRNEKATVAQDELIERFTATIAQSTRLPEYETYQSARTKGSASEFISAVLENYPELLSEKTYLDYIATRPRTEQYAGPHGLFSEEGIDIDLNKEVELVRTHTGNVFSIIVSLKREDAERLEYNSADRWCNLARNKIQEVAQEYGIPLTHLKWFGAFHNESHHPHIHLMLYSTDGCHPGHINKQGVANLRRVFGTAIFREELRQVYDVQTKVRNKLNATAFDEIEELADKIRTGLAQNGDFVLKFIALAKRLQTVSGKKVYGYLPEAVRKQVRELVDVLEQDIKSYISAQKLLDEIGAPFRVPVDYIKSTPYLMSFMRDYQLKRYIENYFKKNPNEANKVNKDGLWINRTKIDNYENITYEGYGPNGVAVIVEVLTDNRNRAAANVRNAFTKGGGNMGNSGCVSFMFDEKGLIVIDKEEVEMDEEELMMVALDAGAEDFAAEEDSFEITTVPDDFSAVREALEAAGIPMASAEVTMIPQTYSELTSDEDIKKMNKLLDLLDDDDDVQNVYHNWDE